MRHRPCRTRNKRRCNGLCRQALGQRKAGRNPAQCRTGHPYIRKEEATAATAVSSMYWGESSAMQQLRMLVEKVAVTDANILITGENGTGKEMLAREIHALSTRHHKE